MNVFSVLGILFTFVVGAAVGSFLNVIVDRAQDEESPFKGRSHCDNCKKNLALLDLVPVFSYLFLRGRCRYCGKKLSIYYPLVEIVTGLIFVSSTLWFLLYTLSGNDIYTTIISLIVLWILSSVLIVIFFADMKYGIIPFNAVILGVIVTLIFHIFSPLFDTSLINYFISALVAFACFLGLYFLTKRKGIGLGDVVYVFLMGLILGYPRIIVGFYIAFLSGALISVILIFLKKKKIKGGTISFGPFLVAGTYISMLFGNNIIDTVLAYLLR